MLTSLFDLTGRVILVTGTGESAVAISKALCEVGAQVVLIGSDQISLALATQLLTSSEYSIKSMVADCSVREQVVHLTERILDEYGKMDVLVNAWEHFIRTPAVDIDPAEWQEAVRVHIKGTFLTCQVVGKQMLQQGYGSIINLSSVAGSLGLSDCVAFSACKGGVEQLTRVLGAEWIKRGVRVNAIASWSDGIRSDESHWIQPDESIPLGRFTVPADLAGTVVYLASSGSAAMTGQVLHVDGGYTAQ